MKKQDDQEPGSALTFSLLISESVYKLVVMIERLIRWLDVAMLPSCRLIYWIVRWG